MSSQYPDLIPWPIPFMVALFVAAVMMTPIFRLLRVMKSRQTVSQYVPEHAAKQGTPTMGGLIIGVGFLAGVASVFALVPGWVTQPIPLRYFGAYLVMFLLFTVIGFVDDYVIPRMMVGKRGLGWTQKLVMQFVSACSFIWVMGSPMPFVEVAAGVFLILFFSNAYNFSDGMDALAGSLLIAICFGLGWFSLQLDHLELLPPLAALIGGAIPFLYLNRPPAKVFMGDVGALPIGAILGAVVSCLALPSWHPAEVQPLPMGEASIYMVPTWPVWVGLAILSFVMVVELVPVPLQILSVKLRKKRMFPMTPIHHAYQKAGWKESRVVAMFVGVQIACSILGPLFSQVARGSLTDAKKDVAIEHIRDTARGAE